MTLRATVFVLVLLASGPGCMFGPRGLPDSSTRCETFERPPAGFELAITEPERLAGRCATVSFSESPDDPIRSSKVNVDGRAYLSVDGPGRYYVHVSANSASDPYCQDTVGETRDHPGNGIVKIDIAGNRSRLCA